MTAGLFYGKTGARAQLMAAVQQLQTTTQSAAGTDQLGTADQWWQPTDNQLLQARLHQTKLKDLIILHKGLKLFSPLHHQFTGALPQLDMLPFVALETAVAQGGTVS